MNGYRKKIKDATEKMMALVAELSMKQALAIELQKEVREKEEFIFSCNSRIEKGLPLNKDIEREWLKVLRDEEMYALAIAEKSRVSCGFCVAFITCGRKGCSQGLQFSHNIGKISPSITHIVPTVIRKKLCCFTIFCRRIEVR